MTPDMAVVTPLNNFLGPEGDTVTVDELLLNTQYSKSGHSVQFSSGQKNLYLPVVRSVQFSSGQKKGVAFLGPA